MNSQDHYEHLNVTIKSKLSHEGEVELLKNTVFFWTSSEHQLEV